MDTNSDDLVEKLKDKTLALFFTAGISLKTWHDIGMIDGEVAIYNDLSKYFKHIYFFTYGGEEDRTFKKYLAGNISIIPKKGIVNTLLYSVMIPFVYHKILKDVEVLKTNQMWGAWSAVLTKLIFRNKLVVRTGFMLSLNFKRQNSNSRRIWLMKMVELVAYKVADGIITSSQSNFEYVKEKYKPRGMHVVIPNYVDTDVFKPMKTAKKKGSICFVGSFKPAKNLFALFKALKGLPYSITIIGSGEQEVQLKKFADENGITVNFLGNIPNHELPEFLNLHELFILPSLYENMPKALLEAMSCGMSVIGTNVKGINE
ncbi:MAG: glycosyltransferase family 4 protein, partial [Methanophagales archaeon]|nr:glycosyltransferase family 4 protein [Methanophagales archaeon]